MSNSTNTNAKSTKWGHAIRTSWLWLGLVLFSGAGVHASNLQDVAAGMSPGEWREYTSSNWGREFSEAEPGSSVSILDFSQRMHWDPVNKQLWMWGKGHGASRAKLIRFDTATDTWAIMPDPTPFTSTGHAYEEQAIDVAGRYLYKKQHSDKSFHRMNLDTGAWETDLFAMGSGAAAQAIEVFPNFQGRDVILNYDANTGLSERVLSTGSERSLYSTGQAGRGKDIETGKNHNLIVYDPANEAVVLGGGNGDQSGVNYAASHLYMLSKDNVLTKLDDIPNTLLAQVDSDKHYLGPGSRRGLLCPGGNGKLYAHGGVTESHPNKTGVQLELNPVASRGNQWRRLPDSPLDTTTVNDWFVCTLIPEYQVIVYNTWKGDGSKMFLFKPGVCADCPVAPGSPNELVVE